MTKRKHRSALQKAKTFQRHGGVCYLCREKIQANEEWEEEHIVALELGGEDEDHNRAPAHKRCHKDKTAKDKKLIAKSNRIRAKHLGAKNDKRYIVPGSRASPWMKKADGTVVRRSEDPDGKGKMR